MSEKTMKITLEFNPTSARDQRIIAFINEETQKMKQAKLGLALAKAEIVKSLLSEPTKLHRKKVKESFLLSFNEEDKLNAIYKEYIKERDEEISLADFSLNHLGNIKIKERKSLISKHLQ